MPAQTATANEAAKKNSSNWTFFSNHAHVLLSLDAPEDKVLRDVAIEVGITERAVQNIVADLVEAGVVTRYKEGRCNRYKINRKVKLRHAIESHRTVGDLLDFIYKD